MLFQRSWSPNEGCLQVTYESGAKEKLVEISQQKILLRRYEIYIYICELHVEEKYMNRNENRVKLINANNSVLTIFSNGIAFKKFGVF